MNGRIERFFGTLKSKTKLLIFPRDVNLQTELDSFQVWYNLIKTHENIAGLTPAEMWNGKLNRHSNNYIEVFDWDGLLTGYYFPD